LLLVGVFRSEGENVQAPGGTAVHVALATTIAGGFG